MFLRGAADPLLVNFVNMQYRVSNKLAAQTLFRIFIAHCGLHDAHSLNSKAIEQVVAFPRKSIRRIVNHN